MYHRHNNIIQSWKIILTGCLSPTFNHSEWPLARQTSVANNATIAFEDVRQNVPSDVPLVKAHLFIHGWLHSANIM